VNSLVVYLVTVVTACTAVIGLGRGDQTKGRNRALGTAPATNPEQGWRRARSALLLILLLSFIGALLATAIGVTVFTVNLFLRHSAGAGG
jgi:hypothetical protein